jgi:iron(III) transport system permease protein
MLPILHIDYHWILLRNSLLVGGIGATIAVTAACMLPICSLVIGGRAGRIVLCLAAAFLLVPTYALAGAWSSSGSPGGFFSLAPVDAAKSMSRAIFAVSWIHAVAKLPIAVLCLAIAIQRVRFQLLEQALVDQGWSFAIRKVLLPIIRPSIVATWLVCLLLIHADMVISNLYKVETLTERVYLDMSLGSYNATTVVWCLSYAAVLAIITLFVLHRVVKQSSAASATRSWWSMSSASHTARTLASVVALVLITVFVISPFSTLVYKSGFSLQVDSQESAWTFDIVRSMQSVVSAPVDFSDDFLWTIQLSLWSTLVAIAIGGLLLWIANKFRRCDVFIALLAFISIAMPGPIINDLAIKIFNRDGDVFETIYNDTLIPCIFCLQFRLVPIVLLIVWPATIALRQRYASNWRLDFANRGQWFVQGFWPAMRWPMLMAVVLVIGVAAGELSTYLLVLPPGVTTIAMRIFDLLHYAVRYREAGLLVGLSLAGCTLSFVVIRRFVL